MTDCPSAAPCRGCVRCDHAPLGHTARLELDAAVDELLLRRVCRTRADAERVARMNMTGRLPPREAYEQIGLF